MTPLASLLAHPDIARLARALDERPGRPMEPSGTERLAAIALVIRPGADSHPELLMIKRAEAEGDPWSGHVACPGGRMNPGDRDLAQTAARETWEETGIDIERDGRMLGTLDDISPRTPVLPPIIVRPFVVAVRPALPIAPSSEVAEAFWVPLAALRARAAWGVAAVSVRGHGERQVEVFRYGDYVVWGLTERVVRQFLACLEG